MFEVIGNLAFAIGKLESMDAKLGEARTGGVSAPMVEIIIEADQAKLKLTSPRQRRGTIRTKNFSAHIPMVPGKASKKERINVNKFVPVSGPYGLAIKRAPTPLEIIDAMRRWDGIHPLMRLRFKCKELELSVSERWLLQHCAYEVDEAEDRIVRETIVRNAVEEATATYPDLNENIEEIHEIHDEFYQEHPDLHEIEEQVNKVLRWFMFQQEKKEKEREYRGAG
jgi:hypothetical protein